MIDNILCKCLLSTQPQLFRDFSSLSLARFSPGKYVYIPPSDGSATRILFCAHLDTVDICFPQRDDMVRAGGVWSLRHNSRCACLGADDRAGVAALISLFYSGFFKNGRAFAVFCDEERGAVGSQCFDIPLLHLELVVGLDRRGSCDLAEYGHYSPELRQEVRRFGFLPARGSFSDCSVISDNYDVPCGNLSVGYFKEHTPQEILSIPALAHTIRSIKSINWGLGFSGVRPRWQYGVLDDGVLDADFAWIS